MSQATSIQVTHNTAEQRFETRIDGWLCRCDYITDGNTLTLAHTEVPKLLEGRGIAGQLVKTAMDYAREKGMKVRPLCSYVRVYMDRHPETQDLRVS